MVDRFSREDSYVPRSIDIDRAGHGVRLARAGHDIGGDARQGFEQGLVLRKGQRHERRARLDDLVTEPARDVIGKARRAEFGDSETSAGEHQCGRLRRRLAEGDMEAAVAMLDAGRIAKGRLDPACSTFVEQHRNNLLRRSIAEQLAKGLFVPRNAMAFDQFDEVGRSKAAQRRFGEMRIGRQEIRGRCTDIGEIASPAAGNQDLAAWLRRMVDEKGAAPPLPRLSCAKHSRRAGADNDCVKGTGCQHGRGP